ncbi:MAG: hypothetical protein KKA84_12135 [Bacteroidetes bacterium]|nr:hypothetical protein [Bacteroidota bacterium]
MAKKIKLEKEKVVKVKGRGKSKKGKDKIHAEVDGKDIYLFNKEPMTDERIERKLNQLRDKNVLRL